MLQNTDKSTEKSRKVAAEDMGAAMMAWYAESLERYPDGLVTQGQAAKILGLSRTAVSRLVNDGYLRAVYFPESPAKAGVIPPDEESIWARMLASLAGRGKNSPVCYVSFADVIEMWLRGKARRKCQLEWDELIEQFRANDDATRNRPEDMENEEWCRCADAKLREFEKAVGERGVTISGRKLDLHRRLLDWAQETAKSVGLTRNQFIFWIVEQWKKKSESSEKRPAREALLPNESEIDLIQSEVRREGYAQTKRSPGGYVRLYDEFGGDLGVVNKGVPPVSGMVD